MNAIPYIISPNGNQITLVIDGVPNIVNRDNMNFTKIRSAIFEGDWDAIPSLLTVRKSVEALSENIEIVGNSVLYKGYQLHGVVIEKLLQWVKEGLVDVSPLANFIEKLQKNPSKTSIDELYDFMQYKSLPINADGDVLGYKGVTENYWSSRGSFTTRVLQGEVNGSGQILNKVGETIEVERSSVDDNREMGCSQGLHVGSYDYACGWAGSNGRLLLVSFNPADVVSVPSDCGFQKLRTCKYKVIADVTGRQSDLPKPYYSDAKNVDKSTSLDYLTDDEIKGDLEIAINLFRLDLAEQADLDWLLDHYDSPRPYRTEDVERVLAELGDNRGGDEVENKIENYLSNAKDRGVTKVSPDKIQSSVKKKGLYCADILDIAEHLGYIVVRDDEFFCKSYIDLTY